MSKNHYSPNDQRSISMNPNNPAYYGSRDLPVPPSIAVQDLQTKDAGKQDSSTGGENGNQKPRD